MHSLTSLIIKFYILLICKTYFVNEVNFEINGTHYKPEDIIGKILVLIAGKECDH